MPFGARIAWYASIGVEVALIAQIYVSGVWRQYAVFLTYLIASLVQTLLALTFPIGTNGALPLSYTYFWLWSEPMLLLLQIAVAVEIHGAVSGNYPQFARGARRLLYAGVAMALVAAAAPLRFETARIEGLPVQAAVQVVILAKRYISTVLAVFLVLSALVFSLLYGRQPDSILNRHRVITVAYFAAYALACLVANLEYARSNRFVNTYLLPAAGACLLCWLFSFRRCAQAGATEAVP